jgi:hypothetical protein
MVFAALSFSTDKKTMTKVKRTARLALAATISVVAVHAKAETNIHGSFEKFAIILYVVKACKMQPPTEVMQIAIQEMGVKDLNDQAEAARMGQDHKTEIMAQMASTEKEANEIGVGQWCARMNEIYSKFPSYPTYNHWNK